MVPQGCGGLAEINKKILPCVGATSITSSRGVLSRSDAVEVVIAYMCITIFVQGRLIQLSTSNNIISTPWGQQLYVSMLMQGIKPQGMSEKKNKTSSVYRLSMLNTYVLLLNNSH